MFMTSVFIRNLFIANFSSHGGLVHDYFWKDLYVHLVENPVIVKIPKPRHFMGMYTVKNTFYTPPLTQVIIKQPRGGGRKI